LVQIIRIYHDAPSTNYLKYPITLYEFMSILTNKKKVNVLKILLCWRVG
jgi:hypothetical protein